MTAVSGTAVKGAGATAGVDEPVAFLVSGQSDPQAVQLTACGCATGAGPSCGLAPVAV